MVSAKVIQTWVDACMAPTPIPPADTTDPHHFPGSAQGARRSSWTMPLSISRLQNRRARRAAVTAQRGADEAATGAQAASLTPSQAPLHLVRWKSDSWRSRLQGVQRTLKTNRLALTDQVKVRKAAYGHRLQATTAQAPRQSVSTCVLATLADAEHARNCVPGLTKVYSPDFDSCRRWEEEETWRGRN